MPPLTIPRDDYGTCASWAPSGASGVAIRCPACTTRAHVESSAVADDGTTTVVCPAPNCRQASEVKLGGWPAPPAAAEMPSAMPGSP